MVGAGPCILCLTSTTRICSRCRSNYCSKECQKADWPLHKLLCKRMVEYKPSPGGEEYVRGIYLAENEEDPQIVKVPVVPFDEGDGDVTPIHSTRSWTIGETEDSMQGWSHIPVSDGCVAVAYNDSFLINGSHPNRCLLNITGKKIAGLHWRGPLLVVKNRLHINGAPTDVSLLDLRHAINFLISYPHLPG